MSRLITLFLALASLAGAQSSLFQLLDTPVPTATAVQAVGDVDGDGDQDLLIPDGVMINDGHGRFARMAVASVAFTRQSARLADLTGLWATDPDYGERVARVGNRLFGER